MPRRACAAVVVGDAAPAAAELLERLQPKFTASNPAAVRDERLRADLTEVVDEDIASAVFRNIVSLQRHAEV